MATLLYGGNNAHPCVESSGEHAIVLASLIRATWPEHRVSRADVAIDLYGESTFGDLTAIAEQIAQDHKLKLTKITKPLNPDDGETIYLGSRSSVTFCRIYEKGKQQAGAHPDVATDDLAKWVRIEIEVKPQKQAKSLAATLEPAAFFGVSGWTRDLYERVMGMTCQPVPFHTRRQTADDAAFAHCMAQYGSLLRRRVASKHSGDVDGLLNEIRSILFPAEEVAA